MDLSEFAEEIGDVGPVTIAGLATRGGPVDEVRTVMAPGGIDWIQPDEMTVQCGAGTPVEELDAALAAHGQSVAIPPTGTVGGALAVGHSGLRRLGYGPMRDALLQARYVNAGGELVQAGGPTVKNVSGFDLCRLLVGSYGTLGFIGEVILRTRPRASFEQWFASTDPPATVLGRLYRPTSVLWDGTTVWALLEGDPADIAVQADEADLAPGDPPTAFPPTAGRSCRRRSTHWSGQVDSSPRSGSGSSTTSFHGRLAITIPAWSSCTDGSNTSSIRPVASTRASMCWRSGDGGRPPLCRPSGH